MCIDVGPVSILHVHFIGFIGNDLTMCSCLDFIETLKRQKNKFSLKHIKKRKKTFLPKFFYTYLFYFYNVK